MKAVGPASVAAGAAACAIVAATTTTIMLMYLAELTPGATGAAVLHSPHPHQGHAAAGGWGCTAHLPAQRSVSWLSTEAKFYALRLPKMLGLANTSHIEISRTSLSPAKP